MNIKLAQGDETRTSPHGTSVEHERMFVKKRRAEIHGGREGEREWVDVAPAVDVDKFARVEQVESGEGRLIEKLRVRLGEVARRIL